MFSVPPDSSRAGWVAVCALIGLAGAFIIALTWAAGFSPHAF
ncbi:hypothetical protein [Neoasaia chiangmaiensis]|nr:hypothetical protein [Neoasaia chiangmaiensis]